MAAPSRLFALMEDDDPDTAIYALTREELNDYIVGTPEERIYEFQFVREHPINVDLQQDPEENLPY